MTCWVCGCMGNICVRDEVIGWVLEKCVGALLFEWRKKVLGYQGPGLQGWAHGPAMVLGALKCMHVQGSGLVQAWYIFWKKSLVPIKKAVWHSYCTCIAKPHNHDTRYMHALNIIDHNNIPNWSTDTQSFVLYWSLHLSQKKKTRMGNMKYLWVIRKLKSAI